MRQFAVSIAMIALLLAGCKAQEEVKPEDAPPPPPTADELYAQLRQPLDPMFGSVAANSPFSNAQRRAAVDGVRANRAKMGLEPNGPEAFKRITSDVEDLIKRAKTAENWRVVKGGIETYKIFEPADKRWNKDEEYADLILARPTVAITGFFELDGEPVVFLDVTEADSNKKTSYKIREGEDFHEVLQLVRIIGRRDSIEMLYKPVNQTWNVSAPSRGGK